MKRLLERAYAWQRQISWRRLAVNIDGLAMALAYLIAAAALIALGVLERIAS